MAATAHRTDTDGHLPVDDGLAELERAVRLTRRGRLVAQLAAVASVVALVLAVAATRDFAWIDGTWSRIPR